jgi:endonuclease III-like uncharacterized protein
MDMNIIFLTILLYDFMHLQFISDAYGKNILREVNLLNIVNKVRIVPNLSISLV